MTYIDGDPVTGFTLELDGETEALTRVWNAICRAMQWEISRAAREQSALWGGPRVTRYEVRPLMPFHG